VTDPTKALAFQSVIAQMETAGWKLGDPAGYNRAFALYPEDVVGFVKDTQPEQWQKFCALYPSNAEFKFLERVAEQLDKADPNAADKALRTFGTLGVLRHEGDVGVAGGAAGTGMMPESQRWRRPPLTRPWCPPASTCGTG